VIYFHKQASDVSFTFDKKSSRKEVLIPIQDKTGGLSGLITIPKGTFKPGNARKPEKVKSAELTLFLTPFTRMYNHSQPIGSDHQCSEF